MWFYERREAVSAQLAELEAARDMVLFKCGLYEQAVELGLMDQIGTLSDALRCLYDMIDHRKADGNEEGENKLFMNIFGIYRFC